MCWRDRLSYHLASGQHQNLHVAADAMEWIIRRKGVAYVYQYLDDFITLGECELMFNDQSVY